VAPGRVFSDRLDELVARNIELLRESNGGGEAQLVNSRVQRNWLKKLQSRLVPLLHAPLS
jgi:hypothetical protein